MASHAPLHHLLVTRSTLSPHADDRTTRPPGGRARALLLQRRAVARRALFARQPGGRNPEKFERSDLTITEWPLPVLRNTNNPVEDFDDEFKAPAAR